MVVVEPTKKWVALDMGELWSYRELLYFLTWRDVKVRYKQTALGAAWAVLQPIAMMTIFTLLFGRLGNMPSDGIPYPIFAYTGLLPWLFFSNSVTNSGNSLVASANLITKVYFPRILVPAAAVGAGLVDFVIAAAILAVLMVFYGVVPAASILLLPLLVVLTAMLALGVGLWMSALNVKYRDIRYALPFVIQLWMFASPIIYPVSMVPEEWRWLLQLNPLTGLIQSYRDALFGSPIDWTGLAISAGITTAVLTYSIYTFRGMERTFADIV